MYKDITSSSTSGGDSSSDGATAFLTKENAILAYEEVFKMWKVELDS